MQQPLIRNGPYQEMVPNLCTISPRIPAMSPDSPPTTIAAVDLFCGAGGLSYGLGSAGIDVVAGIDLDPACEYAFSSNNDARFLCRDVATVTGAELSALWAFCDRPCINR